MAAQPAALVILVSWTFFAVMAASSPSRAWGGMSAAKGSRA
ncbi:hypothetical protein [uncultured Olsenella sp.]|nr:hypothetical protein [uncultured Olsenella sp.]